MATIDTIRILIQDTGLTPILSDSDITAALTVESNIYRASALCCRSLAAYYAKKVSLTVDVIKIENTQKYDHYISLAKVYDARAKEGGGNADGSESIVGMGVILTGVSTAEIESVTGDTDRVASIFSVGLDDDEGMS
jgi:hypothetical protein